MLITSRNGIFMHYFSFVPRVIVMINKPDRFSPLLHHLRSVFFAGIQAHDFGVREIPIA